MKLNTLMVINAIVAGVFGIAFVLVPGSVVGLYGATATLQVTYVAQAFGAALITLAVVTWLARNSAASEAQRAIVVGLAVGDTIGFVVALIGQFRTAVNGLGWSTVVIYLLLAVGFWTFALRKGVPGAEQAH